MSFSVRPTWAEISLDALKHNLHAFRETIPSGMKLMTVIKANAYGHGAQEVAKTVVEQGADYLAVATLEEALELRHAGIMAPLLVLGYTPPEGVELSVKERITLTVYTDEVLDVYRAMNKSQPVPVHIKLDTGMGRHGVYGEEESIAFIEKAIAVPTIEVEALYTHFAAADETDKTYTRQQHRKFVRVVEHFRSQGIEFPLNHTGNSATAIEFPELSGQMIRIGISLYGLYPSAHVDASKVPLKPVMQFKTRIVYLKTVPPDTGVSYGVTHRTDRQAVLATLPVGYADGYSRMLSGKATVIVRGRKVPVVGRICMDSCVIDVTDVPDVSTGDEVVLIGTQGKESITAEWIGELLDTINYEVVCMVSYRVPRVYK